MAIKSFCERFWSKVEKRGHNQCWPWRGAKCRGGYGHMYVGPHDFIGAPAAALWMKTSYIGMILRGEKWGHLGLHHQEHQ